MLQQNAQHGSNDGLSQVEYEFQCYGEIESV